MNMLSTDTVMSHFDQVSQSYQHNLQRCRFAKSARHHAGLRAVFKTKPPPQRRLLSIQPKTRRFEPKSQASTLTLSLHRRRPRRQSCAPRIDCRRLWRRLSAQGRRSGSSRRSLDCTRSLASAIRPWAGEGGAPAHSKPIQGDCASLQWRGRRARSGSANT